jgi:RNA polymerase-binding transcription factor DksA
MAKSPKSGKGSSGSKPAREAVAGSHAREEKRESPAKAKAEAKAVVPTPDEPKPVKWPKGGPSKSDLKRYRQALLDLRRNLLASSKSLAAEALKASGQDFSVDHMADHGSDNYEQDFNLKLLEGESEQLADIRDALMKIDGKMDVPFGICEACVDAALKLCETCPWIPPSRLDVLPHARLCVPTKEMQEDGRLS